MFFLYVCVFLCPFGQFHYCTDWFVCLSMCFSSFLSFLHYYKSIERKPQLIFSFFIFAAINLIFLVISMVSSNSSVIFNFCNFSFCLLSYFGSFCFSLIPKYPNYLGGGRVWWVLVIFCAYPHTINFRVYFFKI